MLARLALQILCDFWGLTDDYIGRVVEFVHGVPWDTEDDVRLLAISIAGDYLRERSDNDILATLLRIYHDPDERQIIRETAYRAVARAMGSDWQDLPSAARHFDLANDVDASILGRAERRAHSEPQ
jgi:hypothetical protein